MIGEFESKTGGPAYPGKFKEYERGEISNNVEIYKVSSGMTLRDYFAAAVLSNPNACGSPKQLAHWAYEVADAMLAERTK